MAQHLVGLALAVPVYLVLRRWAVWRWLAVAAVAPVALIGHDPGPTTAVAAMLTVALTIGLWSAPPRRPAIVAAVGLFVAGVVVALVARLADDPAVGSSSGRITPLAAASLPALVGLVAATGVARAAGSGPLRIACLAASVVPLTALPIARSDHLVAHAWWPAAGALGLTALLRGRRGASARHSQEDDIDRLALAGFATAYGTPRLGPVCVVIAAYNEADGLPAVLAWLPAEVCGLAADVLVVDDGSTDATAAVVEADPRTRLVRCRSNRGQGAALRLGYRVARDHGAAYVLTTDADGQYDPGDLPVVLQPILDGRADFVTGSRRRGHVPAYDRVRRIGVYVFAWLASALLGRWLTDTSFGLRAMRAEVTAAVTLNQPQYQASELLVGVVSHGFRVLEVPGTLHRRSAGATKKGRNRVYGRRYAQVMLGTWWREGCPAPVTERAPALRGWTDG